MVHLRDLVNLEVTLASNWKILHLQQVLLVARLEIDFQLLEKKVKLRLVTVLLVRARVEGLHFAPG